MSKTKVIDAEVTCGRLPEQAGYATGVATAESAQAPEDVCVSRSSVFNRYSLLELAKRAVSFPAMLGALLVGVLAYALQGFKVDPDLWWHLRTGDLILSTHNWPTTDPYSFTSFGAPWISCEWLGDVIFATIHRLAGLRGLQALHIVMASAVVLSIYALGTLRSKNSKAGFITAAILLPITWASFNLRPQMLGYFFLIFTVIALERFRQGRQRTVWLLPLLFLVWINTHGSWIIGLGVIAVYFASGLLDFQSGSLNAQRWTRSERLRLEAVLMFSLAVIPVTPYGTELAAYPFKVSSKYPIAIASISEWLPMPFNSQEGKFFLALILGFLLVQTLFRFHWYLAETSLLFGGIVMASLHRRFLLLFVPFFTPFLATIAARWVGGYDKARDKYAFNCVLVALIAIAIVHWFPSASTMKANVAKRFPVAAVNFLEQHPVPGRLFNDYQFGGYLVGTGYKTFVDGRTEMFEETGVFPDYMRITGLKTGALNLLNAYKIHSCLLQPEEPLAVVLSSSPDWQRVYSDKVASIYVRRGVEGVTGELPSALIPQANYSRALEK